MCVFVCVCLRARVCACVCMVLQVVGVNLLVMQLLHIFVAPFGIAIRFFRENNTLVNGKHTYVHAQTNAFTHTYTHLHAHVHTHTRLHTHARCLLPPIRNLIKSGGPLARWAEGYDSLPGSWTNTIDKSPRGRKAGASLSLSRSLTFSLPHSRSVSILFSPGITGVCAVVGSARYRGHLLPYTVLPAQMDFTPLPPFARAHTRTNAPPSNSDFA